MTEDSSEWVPEPNLGIQGWGIPSPCLEEARQIIRSHELGAEADAEFDGGEFSVPDHDKALQEQLNELAARYGVDPEDLGYGLADEAVDDEVRSVIGDAQERTARRSIAEFSHGGRYYRVVATATQYPILEIKGRRDGGRWTEVDPSEDMALYDAFVSAAESIFTIDHPDDRPTAPDGRRHRDPLDQGAGGP